jgi:hypothetical protein
MIKTILLMHPQSVDLLPRKVFRSKLVDYVSISCGTSKVADAHLSEAADFFPTYASWNSALFETSMILTVWEHADNIVGDNNVAFLHTDVQPHFKASDIWKRIDTHLAKHENSSIAITAPNAYQGLWDDWIVKDSDFMIPKNDPYKVHCFDNGVFVWDIIRQYDNDIYEWAFDCQPQMIYGHQFACTRQTLDYLGLKLSDITNRLRLRDVGFWTPHVFERLIALYLAYRGEPLLTTAFWHYQSSGIYGPGDHSLYGPRPVRYYKVNRRFRGSSHASRQEKMLQSFQTNQDVDPLSMISRH